MSNSSPSASRRTSSARPSTRRAAGSTLMAVGTLAFDQSSSYRNVLCLGHLDADGRKMSKHLGNIWNPSPDGCHGADAVRWFIPPAHRGRRAGSAMTIDDVVRRVLLTYWNTVSFRSLWPHRRLGSGRRCRRAPLTSLTDGRSEASRTSLRSPRRWSSTRAAGRAVDLRGRSVQLVRATQPQTVLAGRSAALATLQVPAHGHAPDGPLHASSPTGVVGPLRRDRPASNRCTWPKWPQADPAAVDESLRGRRRRPIAGGPGAIGAGQSPGAYAPAPGTALDSSGRWPAYRRPEGAVPRRGQRLGGVAADPGCR